MNTGDKAKSQAVPASGDIDQQALFFHRYPRPGKLEIQPTKPLGNQRDLALAYSPGVAAPCLAIKDNPETAADFTAAPISSPWYRTAPPSSASAISVPSPPNP